MSYKDLEIYNLAYKLAIEVHKMTLELPDFEKYEQGSQIRRSSKSIKDNIAEGYGRKNYKGDFVKFLIYAQASCDETSSQLNMLKDLYPKLRKIDYFCEEYDKLGRKINKFIQYVKANWNTSAE